MVAVIFATTTAETFLNELAQLFNCFSEGSSFVSEELKGIAALLDELEDARAPITAKFLLAKIALSGKPFDRGAAPYQDFQLLVTLRNDIVHMKALDPIYSRGGQWSGVATPRLAAALRSRGLLRTPERTEQHWIDMVEPHACAEWACSAAGKMIDSTLEALPPGTGSEIARRGFALLQE